MIPSWGFAWVQCVSPTLWVNFILVPQTGMQGGQHPGISGHIHNYCRYVRIDACNGIIAQTLVINPQTFYLFQISIGGNTNNLLAHPHLPVMHSLSQYWFCSKRSG